MRCIACPGCKFSELRRFTATKHISVGYFRQDCILYIIDSTNKQFVRGGGVFAKIHPTYLASIADMARISIKNVTNSASP